MESASSSRCSSRTSRATRPSQRRSTLRRSSPSSGRRWRTSSGWSRITGEPFHRSREMASWPSSGFPSRTRTTRERAVRAALAVRERIRELNEGRSGLSIPEVHSGVNSGEVMVGPSPEASGIAVVGDVVNTASRLADLATAGTVLVEERTWRRTRHAIRYGRRGSYLAKGKSEPVVAYEARAPRTSFPAGRASPLVGAEFVDRELQLERLSAEFRATRKDGRARVVIVSGEAGAGKTRLASEFTRRHPDALVDRRAVRARTGSRRRCRPCGRHRRDRRHHAGDPASPSGRRRIQALAERVATVTTRAASHEDCRCCSGSTSARKATGRREPRTRSTPLGPCWRASRASVRSSSCSTISIGRIRPSWTRSGRSVRIRGRDRS